MVTHIKEGESAVNQPHPTQGGWVMGGRKVLRPFVYHIFRLLDAPCYKLHHPIYSKVCGKIIIQAAPDYKPHLSA